jgi:hypothetical protein
MYDHSILFNLLMHNMIRPFLRHSQGLDYKVIRSFKRLVQVSSSTALHVQSLLEIFLKNLV